MKTTLLPVLKYCTKFSALLLLLLLLSSIVSKDTVVPAKFLSERSQTFQQTMGRNMEISLLLAAATLPPERHVKVVESNPISPEHTLLLFSIS